MVRYAGFSSISTVFAILAASVTVTACTSNATEGLVSGSDPSTEPPSETRPLPTAMPALASAVTTVEANFTPKTARHSYSEGPNPAASPDELDRYLSNGYGDVNPAPGLAYVTRTMDGSTPPAAGPGAKRIARFAHLADLQLADDESPARFGMLDSAGATCGALRPQDPYLCRMANAAVRTINALHAATWVRRDRSNAERTCTCRSYFRNQGTARKIRSNAPGLK